MKTLHCASYVQGDEAAIRALFKRSFAREMRADFWQWRFAENPFDELFIELAWDGDVLAGHYAVSPVVLSVDGEEWPTALSMTTMTHPDYRGRGLFTTLAASLYARMEAQGIRMVWGFPNSQSHRGFIRDLGWRDLYEVPTFSIVLTDSAVKRIPQASGGVVEVDAFDSTFDDLWTRSRRDDVVLTRRDSKYLRWRYSDHPINQYDVIAKVADGGGIDAYLVYKTYEKSYDVVDLYGVHPEPQVDLVADLCRQAAGAGAEKVQMWCPLADPLHRDLEKLGALNGEPVTYFGCRVFTGGELSAVNDYRRWRIGFGDSDVY